MRAKFGWQVVAVLTVAGLIVFVVQHRATAVLRAEVDRERTLSHEFDRASAEHTRLLAAQPEAGEIERAATDRETLKQARAEVESLRQKAEVAARADAEKKARPVERFAVGRTVPAGEWKNVGTETSAAALETALWAGAGGDVDAFAKTLFLIDARTQRAAQTLWASVPEAMRGEYGTPERLIAFLSIKDVPLGAVQVRQFNELQGWPMGPAQQVQVLLTQADGKQKDTSLLLINPGGGWKLVVTEAVVAKYAAMLKEPGTAAGGK
jgi:hypothetical protein